MRGNRLWFVLLFYTTVLLQNLITGYDTPVDPQYHIQTDEGPERYFRYQTLSGQYRKEKRLEDGTVIGSYAWIDDDGILRQRDYIADVAGYRITKSKNLYVGRNMPVWEAMKIAKKYPASAGALVKTKDQSVPIRPTVVVGGFNRQAVEKVSTPIVLTSTTPLPPPSSSPSSTATPCANCLLTPTTYKPDVSYFGSTVNPHVEISNNALPSSTIALLESSTVKPYVEITPNGFGFSTTAAPNTGSSTTGLPLEYLKTGLRYPESSIAAPIAVYDNLPTYTESDRNSLDYNPYVHPGAYFQNGPTYPIDRNGHTYRGNKRYSNTRIGNGYDNQYPEYDGVSVTNDGFRYYIPRAYHEEQTGLGNEKSGSFGYIDPFGIRRVIYYNAKPGEGFQHRKNNRYVGLDATPYDPRPY